MGREEQRQKVTEIERDRQKGDGASVLITLKKSG